jgi:hypothetical protein
VVRWPQVHPTPRRSPVMATVSLSLPAWLYTLTAWRLDLLALPVAALNGSGPAAVATTALLLVPENRPWGALRCCDPPCVPLVNAHVVCLQANWLYLRVCILWGDQKHSTARVPG